MIRGGKKLGDRFLIAIIVLLVVVASWQVVSAYLSPSTTTLHLGDGTFTAHVLTDPADRTKGLSGSSNLPKDEAMLFAFDTSSKWGIWMKDMNYSIDIVWLDESKTVVHYEERVSPSSYPRVYTPKHDARYVVEFASGTIDRSEIDVGQKADFADIKGKP